MAKYFEAIVIILILEIWTGINCKRGFSLGVGRKKSSGSTWLGSRRSNSNGASAPPDPKPAPSSYGWTNPSGTNSKPASNGWSNPGNKGSIHSNQPSSNIGPGGYPVQGGFQKSPPPYSPTNTHGTSFSQNRAAPPGYSQSNPHINPPSYNSHYPQKQTINNHYHYNGPPPAYSQPSHFGMSSSHYPAQSSFGYPGGSFGNSYKPQYKGMGMFGGGGSYGYPGAGSWGVPSYGSGSSGRGSMVKGLLIGAAGGYLANSLVRRVTNPWSYGGHGYGQGYMDRYRDFGYQDRDRSTPAPVVIDPTKDWINCVAYDPTTRITMINTNCSCTVTVTTDPTSGQNISHHDCTPFAQPIHPQLAPQPQTPVVGYGVNNPPPSFDGGMYTPGMSYGGSVSLGEASRTPDTSTPKTEEVTVQPAETVQNSTTDSIAQTG